MFSASSSRTKLKPIGLIARPTLSWVCAVCCAMVCTIASKHVMADEARPAPTIEWKSATVDRSGAVVAPIDSETKQIPTTDGEAVISPEAFRESRKVTAAKTKKSTASIQNSVAKIANREPYTPAQVGQASGRVSRSNFERTVKQPESALLPGSNDNAIDFKARREESIIERMPPPNTSQTSSNDFQPKPTNHESSLMSPARPLPPFRFASARSLPAKPAKKAELTKTQRLPALPSLPSKSGEASGLENPTLQTTAKKQTPGVLASADSFVLAAQPEVGDHYKLENPVVDPRVWKSESYLSDFSPDPIDPSIPVDPWTEMQIYEGKTLNANRRPLVELGRPWYQLGQLNPGSSILGFHNNVAPQFLVFGDFRTAIASNQLGGNSTTRTASELNLDFDLKLTGTERFHMFLSPLDDGVNNTGYLFDDDEFVDEFDAQIDFGYFEGDLGAIVGGFIGKTLPFDLPFAIGEIPLLFQNGIWMEDAFLGFAATIPARNSPRFDISNMDVTFFAGYDQVNSDAFPGDDSAAKIYGMASFIESMNGYWEIDYAFLDDRSFDDRSYHNIGIGFSRRYGRLLSNSTRIIVNAGQSTAAVENTADGVLLLSENSLITGAPSTVVPYLNFFAGFDRPQSAARAAAAGGILRNTGILFESDGMTGYPTLDPTANDTFGMALGLNLLPNDFGQQLVVETAMLGVMGDAANRNAPGDQYGLGVRYQLPLTNAIIFRSDAMVGFRRGAEDINGFRMELRHKF